MNDSKWLTPNVNNAGACPVRLFRKPVSKRSKVLSTCRKFLTPNTFWNKPNAKGWFKNCPVVLVYSEATQNDLVLHKVDYQNVPDEYNLRSDSFNEAPASYSLNHLDESCAGIYFKSNDYADKMFADLVPKMADSGLESVKLPDINAEISYKPLWFTSIGKLSLTGGSLGNLSTIHRGGGDVEICCVPEDQIFKISLPIRFTNLVVKYNNYEATFMSFGPTGRVEAKIGNLEIAAEATLNLSTSEVTIDSFIVTNASKIDVVFSGNRLVDWLLNALSDAVTILFKRTILLVIEGIVWKNRDKVAEEISAAVKEILN